MSDNKTRIEMHRLNDHMHFEARSENGNSIQMDASEKIGGSNKGVRPMETLLMAMAGCSGIDVVMILKKMNQPLDDFKVELEGTLLKVDYATQFSDIHIHFKFWGNLKESKVKKAIDLSINKYCSVSKILEKSATITSSFEINHN